MSPMPSGSAPSFLFVAAVFFLYWTAAANRHTRLGIILIANYFFCARFGLFYLVLLPACSTLDFLVGLGIMRWQHPAVRRTLVWISVVSNLALLFSTRHAR